MFLGSNTEWESLGGFSIPWLYYPQWMAWGTILMCEGLGQPQTMSCAQNNLFCSKSPTALQKGLWTLLCYADRSLPMILRVDLRPPLPGRFGSDVDHAMISAPLAGFIRRAMIQTTLEISLTCQAVPRCSHAEREIISALVKVIKSFRKENMKFG